MEMKKEEKIVPPQQVGEQSGSEVREEAGTREEAVQRFILAKSRLLDINRWHELSGAASATFRLTDAHGHLRQRSPQIGDLIRIDLPGPGPSAGDGFDWVRIETIEDESDPEGEKEFFAFRVRPVRSPGSGDNSSAHFYTSDATSSFIVQREGNTLTAAEKGRNEVSNTDAESFLDKIRNALVALGAKSGLAKPQWKSLMEGVLQKR